MNHILLFCAGLIWRTEVAFKPFITSCASCSVFLLFCKWPVLLIDLIKNDNLLAGVTNYPMLVILEFNKGLNCGCNTFLFDCR